MEKISIQHWLKSAATQLQTITEASFEEAEYILLHTLKKDRVYLISHSQDLLSDEQLTTANAFLQQRLTKKPLAYVLQNTDFYGLNLFINHHVLVPRNDTECLVDWILQQHPNKHLNIIDLGTGSGAIACALKYNRPNWQITATDICDKALAVAQQNADQLHLDIHVLKSDWFSNIHDCTFDIIISNPPYIAKDDPNVMASVNLFEPHQALYADNNGLADIEILLKQAKTFLSASAIIILEHGFQQKDAIHQLAQQYGYTNIQTYPDLNRQDRFTVIS